MGKDVNLIVSDTNRKERISFKEIFKYWCINFVKRKKSVLLISKFGKGRSKVVGGHILLNNLFYPFLSFSFFTCKGFSYDLRGPTENLQDDYAP